MRTKSKVVNSHSGRLLVKPKFGMVLAITALLLVGTSVSAQRPGGGAKIVEIASVAIAEITPSVAVPGTVYSRDEVQITASLGGLLTKVLEPGEQVKKGDIVAALDSRALRLQRQEQEALLARAEIQVRQLESERKRQAELGSTAISEFVLEQTVTNRDLAEADAEIIKVRIKQIDDQIRRASTRAPFDGIVVERMHRQGEEVARGTALARLTATENLEIRAFVPLKYLRRIKAGDQLEVFNAEIATSGVIRALIPTGDVRSQTFEARIDLALSAIQEVAVGELVSVSIPIRAKQQSLVVPRDAVVLRNDGNYVMRITAENTAERVKVVLGDSKDDLIEVDGELQVGDQVAIRGGETLSDGAEVKLKDS